MTDPEDLTLIYAAALAAIDAGLSVLPPKQDGSKAPLTIGGSWTKFQESRANRLQIDKWYSSTPPFPPTYSGIGFVCGAVSLNLECLDFDDRETYAQYVDAARGLDLGELVDRIEAGYRSNTPNGVHWLYRCDAVAGNTKLAQRPKRPDEMQGEHDKVKTLIETRGEGGYIIEAPTNGKVNRDGAYVLISGGVASIVTITPDERAQLHMLARSLDQMPVNDPDARPSNAPVGERNDGLPGDDFIAREPWANVLTPHGWTWLFTRSDGVEYWRRPGKNDGVSATVNYAGSNLLYVFSSSTVFTPGRGYNKFSAYAVLNHGGDFSEAAKALNGKGFGSQTKTPTFRVGYAQSADEPEPTATPFPVEVLPESFQRYVAAISRLKVCPPEYVAVPMLVAAGTTLGNVVRVQLNSSWVEGPQLFAALIGDPGSKKTPATSAALKPLTRLQARLNADFGKRQEQYKHDLEWWEALPKKERAEHDKPDAPEYHHVTVNDVTIEALAVVLSASKGVVLAHDELAGWVRGMDQYRGGKGSDRQHFLSMWSGSGFKVDRKSNPIPLVVDHPCLGVVGGIQPDMLGALADERNRSDGFLDRILWAYPDPIPDRWVDDDGTDSGIDDLTALWDRLYAVYGSTNLLGHHEPAVMRLSDEAYTVWRWWYDEHAGDRNGGMLPVLLQGPWAKMGTQLARLTLILHCLDGAGTNWIDAETIGRAVKLVEYFKAHARRVYAHLDAERDRNGGRDKESGQGMRILLALKEHGEMKQSDVRRKVFHDNVASERVRALLADLEDEGLIKQRIMGSGGRPVTLWAAL